MSLCHGCKNSFMDSLPQIQKRNQINQKEKGGNEMITFLPNLLLLQNGSFFCLSVCFLTRFLCLLSNTPQKSIAPIVIFILFAIWSWFFLIGFKHDNRIWVYKSFNSLMWLQWGAEIPILQYKIHLCTQKYVDYSNHFWVT